MTKRTCPYQNLSLKDIRGETWKDIPDMDGYCSISNFGRVKRETYEMQYKDGRIYQKPEKIIKLQVIKQWNNYKKDRNYFLFARVKLNGKRHSITIARIVYHCFVEKFNLENPGLVILCKDTDNFNIRPSNLRMATRSQQHQRIITRKRFRSPFLDMSERDRKRQRRAILKTLSKQVSQYTKEGKRIRTFVSMAEAQRRTGIFASSIGQVAAGKKISAGGFLWRWGRRKRVRVEGNLR